MLAKLKKFVHIKILIFHKQINIFICKEIRYNPGFELQIIQKKNILEKQKKKKKFVKLLLLRKK